MDISFAFRKFQKSVAGISLLTLLAGFVSFAGVASASTFPDVSSSHYAYSAVDEASDEGWMTGYENGKFGVDDTLTRGQAAKILVLGALGEDAVDTDYDAGFTDVPSSYSLEDYVNTAELYGFVNGYTNASGDRTGKFGPNDPVNRAQFAKMVVEAFGLDYASESLDQFPDVDAGVWYEQASTYYVSTAWAWSVVNGYENGYYYPSYEVTRGQAAIMVNNAQEPSWRSGDDDDDDDDDDSMGDGTLMVELSDDSPDAMTIPSNATSVTLGAWDFMAKGDDVEVDGLTFHQYGVSSLASEHQVYLYEGNVRLTSGATINSTTHEVSFKNLNLDIDSGDTRTFSVRMDMGDYSSSSEVGMELASASKVDANSEVDGDFPVKAALFDISTTDAGTVTIEKNGSVENAQVGEDGATIAKFKLSAATEAGDVREVGLYLSGSVNTDDVENFKLYVVGDDAEPVAQVDNVDGNDVIRFVLDGDMDSSSSECGESDGYCVSKGSSKSFYVTADFNTGRTGDTVGVYVDQNTDLYVVGALYGTGMAVTRTNYDGNANACAASSDADCSFMTLEGGDVTVSSNGPVASDIATGADDVSFLDFTIVSVANVTFDSFGISMDTSSDSSDTTEGLLDTSSDILIGPNFTDIKIWDNTNDEALFAGIDSDVLKNGGLTGSAISESNDDSSGFYLFTDDFYMEAGEEREFSLMADVANVSTLNGMTVTANLELGATYPQLKDVNNKTLTNSSVLVPASPITSKTMTVRTPTFAISLASTPAAGRNVYVKGSNNVPFAGFAFACGDASDCTVTSLTLSGYLDDDADGTWETSSTSTNDGSDGSVNMPTVLSSAWLEDADGNVIASAKGVNNTTWAVTYNSMNWTVDAGDTEIVYVMGNLSTNAVDEDVTFGLTASNVTVEDEDGSTFSATVGGSTSATANGSQSTYVGVVTGGTLTAAVAANTPREDIAIAGATDLEVSKFEFTSTREAFMVTDLSVNNRQSAVTLAALGNYDNNIISLTISYEDEDGNTVEETSPLVEGTASFAGLELYVPADDTADVTVYADLNTISSSGSSATAGEFVDLALAFNNFEAVGQGSGDTYGPENLDANDASLSIGSISFTSNSSLFLLDGAQDVSLTLGSTLTLTIDNNGSVTSRLPVGTVLCIDDAAGGSCSGEDEYIVTSWPHTSGANEDTVTVVAIDDAGDDAYADNSVVFYALPGTGYFSGTNRMHVYESKPTLSLATSSANSTSTRTVGSADDVFAFNVSANSQEKVQLRQGVGGDDENDVNEGNMDEGDVAQTSSAGEVVDGSSAIEVTFDANSVDDEDCFLLDEAYTAGSMDDYAYVSFWINSSETDVTYDSLQLIWDDNNACASGGDDQLSMTTSNTLVNGTALSSNTAAINGGTADSWALVTVAVGSTPQAESTYFGFSIETDGGGTNWGSGDEVRIDGVVFHNDMLVIDMTSDADFSTTRTSGVTASLKESGSIVAQGGVGVQDASHAKVVLIPGGLNPTDAYTTIEIAKGTTKTYTLTLDSGALLDEDGGVNDPLTFTIDYGSSSDGTVTPGDFWWYETNATVRWMGKVSNTSLTNTINY